MKKFYFCILSIILILYSFDSKAQGCLGNMVTNPRFSTGINNGWTVFAPATSWVTSGSMGCLDTFVLIGSGSPTGGGIQQNVNFNASQCYSLCMCLGPQSSNQFSRVRIFAATSSAGVTYASLKTNTYPAGTAQLIDSIDINGTSSPAVYCKNNWVASLNYSRLIIINTPQPSVGGAEVLVDNICLKSCLTLCDSLVAGFNVTVNALTATFTNTSTFTGGSISSYSWDFGDASTSSAMNPPPHTYGVSTGATFTVCLIVTGTIQGQTCKDTICKTISVKPNSGMTMNNPSDLRINNSSWKLAVSFNNENFNFELLDISGKILKEYREVREVNINKPDFDHGIYIIRIWKDGGLYAQRVVF